MLPSPSLSAPALPLLRDVGADNKDVCRSLHGTTTATAGQSFKNTCCLHIIPAPSSPDGNYQSLRRAILPSPLRSTIYFWGPAAAARVTSTSVSVLPCLCPTIKQGGRYSFNYLCMYRDRRPSLGRPRPQKEPNKLRTTKLPSATSTKRLRARPIVLHSKFGDHKAKIGICFRKSLCLPVLSQNLFISLNRGILMV